MEIDRPRISLAELVAKGNEKNSLSKEEMQRRFMAVVAESRELFNKSFVGNPANAGKISYPPRNLSERLLNGEVVEISQPIWVQDMYAARAREARQTTTTPQPTAPQNAQPKDAYSAIRKVTKEQVLAAYKKNNNIVSATARDLGVDRKIVRKHIPAVEGKTTRTKGTANNPFCL